VIHIVLSIARRRPARHATVPILHTGDELSRLKHFVTSEILTYDAWKGRLKIG